MVIGGMATFKGRVDIVSTVVSLIAPQIDLLYVYCNDQESFDNLSNLPLNVKRLKGENLTDRGKFYPCQFYEGTNHFYLTFDDDLLYPADYVKRTLEGLMRHPGCVVSHHGKKLIKRGQKNYYARLDGDQMRLDYRVLDEVKGDNEIDIAGTGCMAFNLKDFCPKNLIEDMMADVEISCQLEGKIKRYAIEHPYNWVKYHPSMNGRWTVWDHFQHCSDKVQTDLVNKHFR